MAKVVPKNDYCGLARSDVLKEFNSKDFDALKKRLKDNGTKYYDEPYLRFKGTKYEQETFFVKDPNENILEIKTLTANPN